MEFFDVLISYYTEMEGTFTNISMDDPLKLLLLVAGAFVGVLAFIVVAFISKMRTGSIIDPMVKNHAYTPETAISPTEGGFGRGWQLDMLKKGSMMRKSLMAVTKDGRVIGPFESENPNETPAEEVKKDAKKQKTQLPTKAAMRSGVASLRFFIPEEKRKSAISRFSKEKNGILSLIISIAATVAIFTILYLLLPQILRLLDNALTMLG